ncbi:MAG TPA: HD domain-containing phosphohydrolase [Bryobacteraceae bacterium]|nr:HD domain-containing phosphohydrolase [Bryobacteraceae bacterium]
MLKRILFVDDEPNVLQAFERQFRRLEVETALGPLIALETIARKGPFAVVVSDLRMPGMDGIQFLSRVRAASPDTVRLMLTGQADFADAVAAVNAGNVFQFLTKPCPPQVLEGALQAALDQHRLIMAERELLQQTLHGAVAVMSEILSLVNPAAFSRASRISRYVSHISRKLSLPDAWQYEIAAMLSQIGCVTVPSEVLDKAYAGAELDPEEAKLLAAQTLVGYNLLAKIPRLGDIAAIIAEQSAPAGHAGKPECVITGARLLKVASDFDSLIMRGGDLDSTLAEMREDHSYDPVFMDALEEVQIEEAGNETRLVSLAQLRSGMIIHRDVRSTNGLLLLAVGQEVTDSALARLRSFASARGIVEPISVTLPSRPRAGSHGLADVA